MESGVITHENLPGLLRAISQRRRQGILEVHFTEYQVHISFVQGRVVEAHVVGKSGPLETLEWLRSAGVVTSDTDPDASTYAALLAALGSYGEINTETFKRAVRHRILNHLYNLDTGVSTFYSFKVQMVEFDREYSPNISIGQVLLDLVAIESEHQQFGELFPEDCLVKRGEEESPALSDEERILYDLMGDGILVSALERQALLSQYHFESSLVSMLSRRIIEVGDTRVPNQDFPGLGTEALLQALDKSIDDSFEAEAMLTTAGALTAKPHAAEVTPIVNQGTEQFEEDQANFSEEPSFIPQRSFGSWLATRGMRFLQSEWTIHVGVLLFLGACAYLPWVWWGDIWTSF